MEKLKRWIQKRKRKREIKVYLKTVKNYME